MITKLLFDKRCILCGSKDLSEEIKYVCKACLKSFEYEHSNLCPVCKHPMVNNQCPSHSHLGEIFFDSYDFIQTYTGFFKNVIYKLKKNGEFMVNRLLFDLLLAKKMIDKDIPVTVVPDSPIGTFRRGRSGMNYVLTLLAKTKYKTIRDIYKKSYHLFGKKQKNKTRNQRLTDIQNQYYLPPEKIGTFQGEIYLLDDVYTTGATMNYGAKLLKDAGFSKVHCISFFRTIMESE